MRGIILKDTIRIFGLKDGFTFWFGWSIRDPIKRWYWEKIVHKEYCTYSGYHCDKRDCQHKHLPYFPKQPKIEIWDWCIYCGEASAQKVIMDPNSETTLKDFWWKVCNDCDETIKAQYDLTMAISFGDVAMKHKFYNEKVEDHIKEQMNKAKAKIEEIEKRTGKPTLSVEFTKTESGYEIRDMKTGEELNKR